MMMKKMKIIKRKAQLFLLFLAFQPTHLQHFHIQEQNKRREL